LLFDVATKIQTIKIIAVYNTLQDKNTCYWYSPIAKSFEGIPSIDCINSCGITNRIVNNIFTVVMSPLFFVKLHRQLYTQSQSNALYYVFVSAYIANKD